MKWTLKKLTAGEIVSVRDVMVKLLKKFEMFYKVFIVLVDLALVNAAYIIAFLIKFNFNLPEFNFTPYIHAMPFITIAALVYFDLYGLLKFYRKTLYDAVISIMFVVGLLGITTVAITYFNQGFSFPRSVLLTAPAIQFVFLVGWKACVLHIKKFLTKKPTVMIIGTEDEMEGAVEKAKNSIDKMDLQLKYVADVKDMDDVMEKAQDVSEIIVCPGVPDDSKMQIVSYCIPNKKIVYIVPHLFEISMHKARLVQFQDMPAFMIDRIGLSTEQKFFKRLMDILVSVIGIIITFPIMLIAALTVKFSSPGSVFYSQDRVTANNKVYKIYKFRTMYEDSEADTGPVISGRNDPRITSVGRFLRKYRIDELPQLFNVLVGEMSMVGPRSERPYFVKMFSKTIPGYNQRSVVKAGITGFAQIYGDYDTSAEDKLRYDLIYIKNYSLILDVRLILQTVRVVLTGNNISHKTFKKNMENNSKRALNL